MMFQELRIFKSNPDIREYLNKLTKAELVAYGCKYYPTLDGVFRRKTKKDLIESILNMYCNMKRNEALEHIKV